MTALAQDKARRTEKWTYKSFTLKSGTKGFKGGRAMLNSVGTVEPATSAAGRKSIGMFAETVDAAAAALPVTVELAEEITVERFINATAGDACAASDVGALCYMLDDQTVTITAAGRSPAGRIWDVDATKGVAVQVFNARDDRGSLSTPAATTPAAYVANDLVLTAAGLEHEAVYDVPTTGAASTITLPAAAPSGTRVIFCADGTKNGHTVQYRDATGPTNLTAALTLSKRHLVVCTKVGANWFANAHVSP